MAEGAMISILGSILTLNHKAAFPRVDFMLNNEEREIWVLEIIPKIA